MKEWPPVSSIDPSENHKEQKRSALVTATTFRNVFMGWLDIAALRLSARTVEKIRSGMEIYALQKIVKQAMQEEMLQFGRHKRPL